MAVTAAKSDIGVTPRERLERGLKYTAVGPVELGRGLAGIGVQSARSSSAWLARRYRRARVSDRLGRDLAAAQQALALELAAAQEVVSGLPQALQDARKARRRRKPLIVAAIAAVTLVGGAITVTIVRRSMRPEPSPLPPSVDVQPKP
ncbi:cell wall synthesis protein CwsA [Mycolicibacterium thermoresistibile]